MGPRERELLIEAFDSNWIAPLGPHVDAFEAEVEAYLGGGHAVALSSGTAALHLALLLLEIGEGDEVWCSSFTFAASANVIRYVGAVPTFVDSEWATWNLDPDLVETELQARQRRGHALPKALIAVDLYGQCVDYARLEPICERFGIKLIEDAAEALGATCGERPAGRFGDMAVFSFNGNKIITTSGGGMLITKSKAQAAGARHLATQAREPTPHYEHTKVGFNYRLSNLLAAVGRGQLSVLDERVEARRAVNQRYRAGLENRPGITFMPEAEGMKSNHWLTCILIDPLEFGATREQVRLALEAADIEARPTWKPMHMQPVYRQYESIGGEVCEQIFEHGLCLPSGSALSPQEQERVIKTLLAVGR